MDRENDEELSDAIVVVDQNGGLMGTLQGLLGFGWRVAKKIAIASVALTSAPIVLPPLAIVSTIGFVFAVPFGALFVGYACTNKIMRVLLPPRPSPPILALEKGEEEGLEGDRWGFDEKEGLEGKRWDFGEGKGKGFVEKEEGEKWDLGEGKGEGFNEKEGLEGETWALGEREGKGMGEEGVGVLEEESYPFEEESKRLGAPVAVGGYPIVSVDVVEREIIMEQTCSELEQPTEEFVEEEVVRPALEEEESFPVVSTTVVKREVFVTKWEGDEAERLPSDAAGPSEETVGVVAAVGAPEPEPVPGAVVRQVEVVVVADEQAVYSEEEIWGQMDAVRKIVGYEAAKALSCMEELKALYLFTGVESPISSESSSDLAEVSNKLQFLKTVIGIK